MIGNALELPVFRTDAPLERRCFNAQLLQPRVVVSNDAIVDRGCDLVAPALGASPELLDSPLSLDQSEQVVQHRAVDTRRVLRHNLMFRPTGAGNGLGLRSQERVFLRRLEPPDQGSGADVAAIREVAADAQFGAFDDETATHGEMPGIVAGAEK